MARHKQCMSVLYSGLQQGVTGHEDLCVVLPPWGCFPLPLPQPGTGDRYKQTDSVLQTELLPPCKFLNSSNSVLKLQQKHLMH